MNGKQENGIFVYTDSMPVIGASSSEHVRFLFSQLYANVLKEFLSHPEVRNYTRSLMDRLNNFQAQALPLWFSDVFKITRLVVRIEYLSDQAAVTFIIVREDSAAEQDVFLTTYKVK